MQPAAEKEVRKDSKIEQRANSMHQKTGECGSKERGKTRGMTSYLGVGSIDFVMVCVRTPAATAKDLSS